MFKASSLLLILVLNIHLFSSAPISANVVLCSVVADDPGSKETANTVQEPERVDTGASPDDVEIEVASAVAVENESQDQHGVDNPAQEAPVQVIPVDNGALEESAQEVEPESRQPLSRTLGEKSAVSFEPETEEVDQDKSAAEEPKREDSSPEDPVVIVLEETTEEDPATNKQPLLSTTEEEEEYVVLVPADLEASMEGQEETQKSSPDKHVVIVFVELTSEELIPEDPSLVIPPDDPEEEPPEDNTDKVQSDPLPEEAALEQDVAPQENELRDSDPEILVISETETDQYLCMIKTVLDPTEKVPEAATEILNKASAEPLIAPALVITGAEVELVPDTSLTTHRGDLKAAVTVVDDEPVALVNRGAVLSAAFFTPMSLITIGFVGMIISKKL